MYLQASFLSGLISVEGSAKYLNDHSSTKRAARVSVKYNAKTKYEALTMSHLAPSKIHFPSVLDDKEATHVVVGKL